MGHTVTVSPGHAQPHNPYGIGLVSAEVQPGSLSPDFPWTASSVSRSMLIPTGAFGLDRRAAASG